MRFLAFWGVLMAVVLVGVGCASLPPPGMLLAGLACEMVGPVVPERGAAKPVVQPVAASGSARSVVSGQVAGRHALSSQTPVERAGAVVPRVARRNDGGVRLPPRESRDLEAGSRQTLGAGVLQDVSLSDQRPCPVEPVASRSTSERQAASNKLEEHAARIQLEGLWREYRNFRYAEVVQHAQAILKNNACTPAQRAVACILAGAACHVLGQAPQAEAYLRKAARLAPGLEPDPNLFPSAVCDMHRAARARK